MLLQIAYIIHRGVVQQHVLTTQVIHYVSVVNVGLNCGIMYCRIGCFLLWTKDGC